VGDVATPGVEGLLHSARAYGLDSFLGGGYTPGGASALWASPAGGKAGTGAKGKGKGQEEGAPGEKRTSPPGSRVSGRALAHVGPGAGRGRWGGGALD